MDLERARYNMIEQQVRPWEVLDQRVLDTLAKVPREHFVPEPYRALAFADVQIPLPHGQVMMPPKMEGRLLQALSPQPDERVLEVGTGSGFLTACLAALAGHVYTVEIFEDLAAEAARRLASLGIGNVTVETGQAAAGWSAHAPYNVIALTGSVPVLAERFREDLAVGGRLFAIVGTSPVMEAILVTRTGPSDWVTESLFETDFPALIDAPAPRRFVF
ncbi:protein-L-isoaspartate O-methyltransferase family protein [Inmirania thermothiophila]|uniref:Protein-L-isoaspartate O-methyltransferase n=1 Tax=Inmirania thermothiophila TaxID=1750597 RepID=A0A3N1Y7K3_9GAMM|nr:protein-L-isoaspartate O-methyltransferase [Inmirania thermothiophila]ROR34755.1 protein-L-isoaspartate(D-aspartate) O-methyltransferase [Inmirania thermothiophila]